MFGEYGGMGFGGIGMIAMFLFWGFIIALVVLLVRQTLFKHLQKMTENLLRLQSSVMLRGKYQNRNLID